MFLRNAPKGFMYRLMTITSVVKEKKLLIKQRIKSISGEV